MTLSPFVIRADHLPEPMLLVSPAGTVLAANRAAAEDLRIAAARGPLGTLCDWVTEAPETVAAFVRLCSSTPHAIPGSLTFRTPDGPVEYRCDGHRAEDGSVVLRCRPKARSNRSFLALNEQIAALAREVAVRRRTEQRLQGVLETQELLIRELHHRIRNSLQVAISLSQFERRYAAEDRIDQRFREHSDRLKAIGLVYQTLYQDKDLTRLDIGDFAQKLCAELIGAYRPTVTAFSIRLDTAWLHVDQAVPFALVVNELVTNAVVHAFEPGRSGCVQVGLRRLPEERLELTVRDDGKGIAAEFIAPGRGKMGLNLVRALARQLGGALDIACGSGTICRIVFRDDRTG